MQNGGFVNKIQEIRLSVAKIHRHVFENPGRIEHLKHLAETYPDKREDLFQSKKKLEIIASNIKTSLGIDLIGKRDSSHGREDSTIKKEEISL